MKINFFQLNPSAGYNFIPQVTRVQSQVMCKPEIVASGYNQVRERKTL
jgi:hypothetical protein